MHLSIKYLNETYLKVECYVNGVDDDIHDHFSFTPQNIQHTQRFKSSNWDGTIYLYNKRYKRLYKGLLFDLLKLCKQRNYIYALDDKLKLTQSIDKNTIKSLIDDAIKPHSKRLPLSPYDYQLDAIHYAMSMNRSTLLSCTSSGKSLIIYCLLRIYQLIEDLADKTFLVIVPSINLVEQLYSDFDDYSSCDDQNWYVNGNCQKISSKYSKTVNKKIVISTWQSIKNNYDILDDVGVLIVDEVHGSDAKVLRTIVEQLTQCEIRHGLTGTLNDYEVHELTIKGLFGPIKKVISTSELIESKRGCDVCINILNLDYPDDIKKDFYEKFNIIKKTMKSPTELYNFEIDYLYSCELRNDFILKFMKKMKGNTLFLFNRVDSYGVVLYERMRSIHKNTFLITGDVVGEDREEIRQKLENYDDAIIFATDKIMSTGVSIKKLHNLIFGSSSKAKIKTLQSIGRLLRLHESKNQANVIDVVDNLQYENKTNLTLKHVMNRVEFYKNEKFKTKFMKCKL